MSNLDDPRDLGFSAALSVIDRCQIAMLREVAHANDGRLVLKGGMAMRVAVGSMRLTKDVAFDRAEGMSIASVHSHLRHALQRAVQSAGLRGAEIDLGKSTDTTVRMRLAGVVQGTPVRFVVEVSGRHPAPKSCQARVQVTPPARDGMAPFVMTCHTQNMLACQPQVILASRVGQPALLQIKTDALDKVTSIDFQLAQQELLPYIPPDQRAALTHDRWEEMTLTVAQVVQSWVSGASALPTVTMGSP